MMAPRMVKIVQPFEIHIDPMERLLLVNFDKDPDAIYLGFEPQVFDDAIHGKGHLVIGWRVDGKVDVYHESTLTINPSIYDIAGKGLQNIFAITFANALYSIDTYGIHVHYSFNDYLNRKIHIRIDEKHPKKRKPFGLLAPMGHAAEHPSSMPLIFLQDFYFVRKKHTVFEISIDGKKHKPDLLPFPMDLAKMYFTRYSSQPLIATLNPAFKGNISSIEVEFNQEITTTENYEIYLVWINKRALIKQIIRKNTVHPVKLEFEDPFPNLNTLRHETHITGNFNIEAHPSTGTVGGEYSVTKTEGRTLIKMKPNKGWKPRPTKPSLRLLYLVARIFKKWPRSYVWSAIIDENHEGNFSMLSKWERIKKEKNL